MKNKTTRYAIAIATCTGIFFLFSLFSAYMKWEAFGGVIVMSGLLAIIALVWRMITKPSFPTKKDGVETEYECIHCGYTSEKDFNWCPKCKKNDDGVLLE